MCKGVVCFYWLMLIVITILKLLESLEFKCWESGNSELWGIMNVWNRKVFTDLGFSYYEHL